MPTLIYKKQLISGAPAVTDNIEAGNMKPVTSNVVNTAVNNINNSLNNKLAKIKDATGNTSKQYTITGTEMHLVIFGADVSNQYAEMIYLYNNNINRKSLTGNTLPSSITFTKSGSNIIITVPPYWVVAIY